MKKEKQNFKFLNKKRIILSLVFLFCILFSGSKVIKAETCIDPYTGQPTSVCGPGSIIAAPSAEVAPGVNSFNADAVKNIGNPLSLVFNMLLYTIFQLVSIIVIIAANIFDFTVNAEIFKNVFEMPAIADSWVMIRDTLNLFFILILLFSAFCTILQIAKYNIKNILLTLVIMALLVNFSYPISRFVIDAGSIPMYYYFGTLSDNLGGGSISNGIVGATGGQCKEEGSSVAKKCDAKGLQGFLLPNGNESTTLQIIAAILFMFIFGITLLVMAVLLVIRIVVLMILVIFSPIGFVAAIFPGFSKYSSDWWEALFKQSFFGTIMAFGLLFAVKIMQGMQNGVTQKLATAAKNQTDPGLQQLVVSGVTLAVPIVLLWAVIISAQKMGAVGGDYMAKKASQVGKWAGKKFTGYNAAKKQVDAFKAARKKREDEKAKSRWGGKLGKKLNIAQDKLLGAVSPAARKRYESMQKDENREDIKKASEKNEGTSTTTIINDVQNSFVVTPSNRDDYIKVAGEIRQLYSRGNMGDQQIRGLINTADPTFLANLNNAIARNLQGLNAAEIANVVAARTAVAGGVSTNAQRELLRRFTHDEMRATIREAENYKV